MKPYQEKTDSVSSRKYDIFCVSQDRKGLIGEYRKYCQQKIYQICQQYGYSCFLNLYPTVKEISSQKYQEALRHSKICFSCPGWGEWVHLDGYAIWSEVVLIKPTCHHIEMSPDIYHQDYCYQVKYDLSDLASLIQQQVSQFSSFHIRTKLKQGRQKLKRNKLFKSDKIWQQLFN